MLSGAVGSVLSRPSTMWLAAVVVLLAAFFGIGLRPLWEPDEGRYVAVALEMLRTGDWIHPALHHEHPHYTKPPLTYWLIASSLGLFGHHEWAARLPNALAFIGTAACVAVLARRLTPGRGAVSAIVYATSILPFVAHHIVTTDTLLALFTTLAGAMFLTAWRPGTDLRTRPVIAMWAAFGLAFLTKGPPSLLLLAAILITLVRWDRAQVRRLFHPLGIALFFTLAFGWFAVVVVNRTELLRYFLVNEFVDRIASDAHGRNPEWYKALMYPALLVAGMLPWSIGWFRQNNWWRPTWLTTWFNDPLMSFMLTWISISLLVFMASSSRLPLYILPLCAPLAACTGRIMADSFPTRRSEWCSLAVTVSLTLLLPGITAFIDESRSARRMADELSLPSGVYEVVYVDRNPKYGVAFYSGASIEEVIFLSDPRPGAHSFVEELDEREGLLAFVVDLSESDLVIEKLREHHWRIIDRRTVRNWMRLIAEPEPESDPESSS